MAQEVVALPAEELERFAAGHDADSVDWVISTCYELIRSVEQIIGDEQKIRGISREKLARTLKSIADRAFTAGWNTKDLTSIQRAQILDILFECREIGRVSFSTLALTALWCYLCSCCTSLGAPNLESK